MWGFFNRKCYISLVKNLKNYILSRYMNHLPITNPDIIGVTTNTPVSFNVLTNDYDPDGDTFTVLKYTVKGFRTKDVGTLTTVKKSGLVIINANGSGIFYPANNYTGDIPHITYTIVDQNGATRTGKLILKFGAPTIIIAPPTNSAPVAVDDTDTTIQGQSKNGNVLTNDTDANGNLITITAFSVNGSPYVPGALATVINVGSFIMYSNGNYMFTPVDAYLGAGPTITYTVSDGTDADSGTLSISIVEGSSQFYLPSTMNVSMGVYRTSDPEPKTLLRTLFADKSYTVGIHPINWDGLDDFGNTVSNPQDTFYRGLKHTITKGWEPVGNSSDATFGSTVLQSYSPFVKAAISGNNIYIGESFNEGGARAGFKILISDPQKSIDILPYATDPNRGNPNDTNISTEFVCTNGTNVFWGGNDPYASYSLTHPISGSWVFGTKVSDDTNHAFSSGSSMKAGLGKTYPNAIDIVIDQPTNVITGMCSGGNLLWVSRQNEIKCYNATTGALLSTTTGFINPHQLTYDSSNGGRVWFLRTFGANTNNVVAATITAGTGALTGSILTISDFPTDKFSLVMDNVTTTLIAVVGGVYQQIWAWDVNNLNPSGTFLWKLGQLGGYRSNVVAATDKFNFHDNTTGLAKGLAIPYACFDGSSNLYVGDVGSLRLQIFNSSRVYQNTVTMQGALYGVSADMNNPDKIYLGPIEYDASSKSMTRNFSPHIQAAYFSQGYDVFRWCSTLSNGRTYATLYNQSTFPPAPNLEIVELSDTGLRYTGASINIPNNYFLNYLDEDFNIFKIDGTYGVGATPKAQMRAQTSFDGSFNPLWGAFTDVLTFRPIEASDAMAEAGNTSFHGITNTGVAIIKNKEITLNANYHLEGHVNGRRVWGTYKPTSRLGDIAGFLGYRGSYPKPMYFERGNSVSTSTFVDVQVVDDVIGLVYNGEGWKGKQTNYFNLYHSSGLPITQFGTDRIASEAIGATGEFSSGNGFSFRFAKLTNNIYYMMNGDESVHSALHLWTLTGMATINLFDIVPGTIVQEVLEGTDLMTSVTFNSILTTTGNITRTRADGGGFTAQSGVTSYDKYEKDITLRLDAGSNFGAIEYIDVDLPAYNAALTSHKIWGEINFMDFLGQESVFTPTAELEVLDDAGLIIARIGLGMDLATEARLHLNSTVVIASTSANVLVNKLYKWQTFEITTNSANCIITYGLESPVTVAHQNNLANWEKPTTVRILVKDLNGFHYGNRSLGVKLLRYSDV